MAIDEKRAWILMVVAILGYTTYLILVLGRSGPGPLAETPYVATMLWTIGGGIVAGIVLHILASIGTSAAANRTDQRDREINQFGEHVGGSFIVIGAMSALVMTMAEAPHFWIANTIYLGFVLSAVLGSAAKLSAYRQGFQPW
ncbi:hypothetical protein [Crossiella cryophila]|uniref:DUF2178 domain-containing protein n=1 Tax=Crossiella cryophila TaxID=43355 RepID=A0A7W7C6X2_9PSEU|nr:hypothetical protein [Crossiella cryophila]MBB4675587.1 hypothetical protein [Crossiella cryophila]